MDRAGTYLSVRTRAFDALFEKLPLAVQEHAEALFRNYFLVDPEHPILRGKLVRDRVAQRIAYRVRVGYQYRAMAVIDDSGEQRVFVWYWIGSHADYDQRLA